MRTIWKYELPQPVSTIEMPQGVVRHVAAQGSAICIWVDVDDVDVLGARARTFHAINTGDPVPDDLTYLGTTHVGAIVWHVFEQAAVGS